MANSKETLVSIISKRLIYLYLILFPLGQLLRVETGFLGLPITIHPTDLVVLALFLVIVASRQKIPKVAKHFYPFFLVAAFSLAFSFSLFSPTEVLRGTLFFARILGYFGLFVAAYTTFNDNLLRIKIFNLLLIALIVVAVFGWIQYFFYPDLRWLKSFGWDDHLYRLTGSFLDPGFAGLILAFGFLISLGAFIRNKKRLYLLPIILFLVSVAFTYSRATYLSLLAGVVVYLTSVNRRVKQTIAVLVLVFIVSIPLLPKPSSSGVQLERLYSIGSRLEYYKETYKIWEKFPVFGVGFNNICVARQMFVTKDSFEAHSCSGSDSGILFILATTGMVGLVIISGVFVTIAKNLPSNPERITFMACAAALFTHSFFANSLFYPWVLGFMAILLAITLSIEKS